MSSMSPSTYIWFDVSINTVCDVSTPLSFFPREYAEAFGELCNSETSGTEELGDARSNKDRGDVQDVK